MLLKVKRILHSIDPQDGHWLPCYVMRRQMKIELYTVFGAQTLPRHHAAFIPLGNIFSMVQETAGLHWYRDRRSLASWRVDWWGRLGSGQKTSQRRRRRTEVKQVPDCQGQNLTRVEGCEINDLLKAPERLNWLLKCKIINQEEENKPKDSGRKKIWHGVSRT